MSGFFGRWADLNLDGEIDDYEKIIELEEMDRVDKLISGDSDEDEEDELEDELLMSGLDPYDLSDMDEDERQEALEDAGLDPDDYDF